MRASASRKEPAKSSRERKKTSKPASGALALINTIQCGDSAFMLKQMPAESVDLVVTSPPYYQQRDYNQSGMTVGSEGTVEDYIESLMDVFVEALRVVKPTGNIVYNVGDKYVDSSLLLVPFRFAMAATKRTGVRLVNNITWVKTNPTPRQFARRLVSSTEPFFHFAMTDDYYYDRDRFLESKDKTTHRPPGPNTGSRYRRLIGESPMSRTQKRNANHELNEVIEEMRRGDISGFRMKIKGIHAEAFGGQDGGRKMQMETKGFTIIRMYGRKMKRDVIETAVETIPDVRHTAMFPVTIIRELIKMLCPRNGVVLDPYMGSGTTAVAAKMERRNYIGVDIDPDYCEIAQERVEKCQS